MEQSMSIYDKLGAKTAGIKARTIEKATEKSPRTAPGMFLSATQRMDEAEARVEELEAKLREAEAMGGREIALDAIHEAPGRRRKLTERQYSELKENLRNNSLVTPVTLRKRQAGGYEIVSGNNRVAVYRELGRSHILAVVLDSDENQAEINAFYANLLQSDLTDFEKFLGFRRILEKHPTQTHAQVAEGAGVSRSFVSQLMAFEDLPEEVLGILAERPELIGANAAQDFAALAKKGRSEQVLKAVRRIANGEIDQGKAVKEAASDPATKLAAAKTEPVRIRIGRSTYCDMRRANNVLRLQFQSAEEASAVQDAIEEMLQRRIREAGK
jgi:ParB family chromosome partitioning protein